MDLDLSKVKKIFFIGIGGIGISALAKMALSRGIEVLGINDEESPKTLEPLREAGAIIYYMGEMKELPDADLYVFSDAWIYRGPSLISEARRRGPTMSYFEALGQLSKEYKVVAISGTHGKTTTTAMVAEILIEAGLDPTVIVGSYVKKFDSNFRKGNGEYLVVEADEYNKHMLEFNPFIGLVTNMEADHLDVYKDLNEIKETFDKFLAQSQNKITDYSQFLAKVPALLVPGEHNRLNAAAALSVADVLGVQEEVAQKALANFSGTWRRLEKRGESKEGTIIYDDYAHHPTEIKASLQALRELYPNKKLTVLFQPHLYSRTKALFDDFSKSFEGADRVIILPIYFAREAKDESVSGVILAEAVAKTGKDARGFEDFEGAEKAVSDLNLGIDDIFVTMGAGEAYKVADKLFNLA